MDIILRNIGQPHKGIDSDIHCCIGESFRFEAFLCLFKIDVLGILDGFIHLRPIFFNLLGAFKNNPGLIDDG